MDFPFVEITTKDEHTAALARVGSIFHATLDTDEGDELLSLVCALEDYEDKNHKIV